ncbi:S1 family peptidase [Sandaracinobacter neustonicus]|uniref:S1 family peptidase n=1 Tax=Sandaracinobacter neustonicus TaxID=1715348 RepID=UPI0015E2F9AC|nr:serine protease [Sandaracinobacter neustonicus]
MIARLAAIALAALAAATAAAQTPSPALVQAALKQVGQVIAEQCGSGGTRTGTAFVWPDSNRVVTARHVVAGCQRMRVQFPGRAPIIASPERELVSEDLLILRLSASSGFAPVRIREALPPVHSRVAAVGYAVGAPTPDDKLLTVTAANQEPGAQLRDMLPAHISQQIQANGPWRLDTAILRLDGNLVSGLSGAPLLSSDGSVVAIGAGGLQDGASGIVWAVRARYLVQGGNWRPVATVKALARSSGLAFADQAPQAQTQQVACGPFQLTRSRTVSLAELSRGTDDPRGLQQVLGAVGGALGDPDKARFDVWVDLESGAAIPLPAGSAITPGAVGCIVQVGPHVGISIVTHRASQTSGPAMQAEIQNVSQMFEHSFAAIFPAGLPPDPSFTYLTPVSRPDGFMVNRKAFGAPQQVGPNQLRTDYVFLTHMTRGRSYAAVSAIRSGLVVPADAAMGCFQAGNPAACAVVLPQFRDWAMAAVSVHLATIPPI